MPHPVVHLSQRARTLPPEQASLEGDLEPEVNAAWDVELKKRIAEVESGTAKLIPADEVFEKVRRSLR
jgi:hypothetical protein